jgi:hypothetical protein
VKDIFIRIGIAALLGTVKNAERKAELKGLCREIVQGILLAYADDPDFLTSLAEED